MPASAGGPRTTNLRAVVNAIFYLLRPGCQRPLLPREYPPRSTVYHYFSAWRTGGGRTRLQCGNDRPYRYPTYDQSDRPRIESFGDSLSGRLRGLRMSRRAGSEADRTDPSRRPRSSPAATSSPCSVCSLNWETRPVMPSSSAMRRRCIWCRNARRLAVSAGHPSTCL
jgi:Putative transposase of IS4/5 family (DUF4096)